MSCPIVSEQANEQVATNQQLTMNEQLASNQQVITNDDAGNDFENDEYYTKAAQYWNSVDPTIEGMLGGFSTLSDVDLRSSHTFLAQFFIPRSDLRKLTEEKANEVRANQMRALDCGAGIGRITKNVLLKFFEKVDLLDSCEKFLKESRNYIGAEEYDQRVSTICTPLQKFKPTDVQYDLILLQWVIGHLYPDQQFLDFLDKCKAVLKPDGLLMIKDNHTSTDDNDLDTTDGSVTRSYYQIIKLIKQSGYKIVDERRQHKMPKGIYPVKMFALKPEETQ